MSSSILLGHARRRFLSSGLTFSRYQNACAVIHLNQASRPFALHAARSVTAKCNGHESALEMENSSAWMKIIASIAATGTLASGVLYDENKTDCCGIAGVVGSTDHDAR
jgi:hypothetical protein